MSCLPIGVQPAHEIGRGRDGGGKPVEFEPAQMKEMSELSISMPEMKPLVSNFGRGGQIWNGVSLIYFGQFLKENRGSTGSSMRNGKPRTQAPR